MPKAADKTWEGGSWAVCQWHLHASMRQLWQEVWQSANKRCAAIREHIFAKCISQACLPPNQQTITRQRRQIHIQGWATAQAEEWMKQLFQLEGKGPKSLPSKTHGPFTNQKQESIDLFNCIWRTQARWTNCVSPSKWGTIFLKAFSICNTNCFNPETWDKRVTNVTYFSSVTKVCVSNNKQK